MPQDKLYMLRNVERLPVREGKLKGEIFPYFTENNGKIKKFTQKEKDKLEQDHGIFARNRFVPVDES